MTQPTPLKAEAARTPRFIDPNATIEKQSSVLRDLIKSPPENSRVITFSPDLANWILENLNTNNRAKRPLNIRKFAKAMTDPGWTLTGDTIKFSVKGMLLDGQNRMRASVLSGVSFRTHVVFGIDDDAFSSIDTGAKRTNADAATIAGIPHPGVAAPCLRWIMIFNVRAVGEQPDRGLSFSNDEVLEFYRSKVDKDALDVAVKRSLAAPKIMPKGSLAALLYLFSQKHAKTAEKFASDLASSQRAGAKLNAKFITHKKNSMGRVHETAATAWIIQAWNAYRSGETVTAAHLNWRDTKEYPAIA